MKQDTFTIVKICGMASNMRCIYCGGWGGEWGSSQNGSSICLDCWNKGKR